MKESRIENIFNEKNSICIGRFLIDVPSSAQVIYGPAEVPAKIKIYDKNNNNIQDIIAARLSEIREERNLADEPLSRSDSLLGRIFDGEVAGQKIIFGLSRASGMIYRINSYFKMGDKLVEQEISATNNKKNCDNSVSILNSIALLVRSRERDEIPINPGLCIEYGFINEPKINTHEMVALGIRFLEFPDVHFSIVFNNKDELVESDALEPRLKRAEQDAKANGKGLWYSRIKTLRRGNRVIGKWHGYEVLARMPAQAKAEESHEFAFLSQGEPGNSYVPLVDMEMNTGVADNHVGGGRPSITDEEAIALWDKLTNSIRVRPVTGKPEKAATAPAELGTLAQSGTPCPQTGWWKCTDGDYSYHVEGGERRHFVRGTLMPKAVLVATPSLWQKITSTRTRFSTASPSIWKLVEVDPPAP